MNVWLKVNACVGILHCIALHCLLFYQEKKEWIDANMRLWMLALQIHAHAHALATQVHSVRNVYVYINTLHNTCKCINAGLLNCPVIAPSLYLIHTLGRHTNRFSRHTIAALIHSHCMQLNFSFSHYCQLLHTVWGWIGEGYVCMQQWPCIQ